MNKNNLNSKLIIGSANFTQKYGVDLVKINHKENEKIIKLAKKKGINEIDTAETYLKDHSILNNIDKKFKFSTKVIPDKKWLSLDFCQEKLKNHFKYLNNNMIETLLFHDIKVLLTKDGKKIFDNLDLLKKRKYFKKIGLSIYETNNLNFVTSKFNFDVIQCPYNILDNRIISSGWFDKLKAKGIEIHVRSIFLQGLLVNKSLYKKQYFNKWKNFFIQWFAYLKKNNISPIDYCLSDVLNKDFDKIIIGINNSKNLKQILNFKFINKKKMINLNISDKKLIDPRKWK